MDDYTLVAVAIFWCKSFLGWMFTSKFLHFCHSTFTNAAIIFHSLVLLLLLFLTS